MAGATKVEGLTAEAIDQQLAALVALERSAGLKATWNLMEEWDQAGGRWVPQGRPLYGGLTRQQAHEQFTSYYLEQSPPLGTYLRQPQAERSFPLLAQTDFPINALTAYGMGVDLCLLERGIDELSDLSTGIAFVRGAAAQAQKTWGIDLAAWRTGNGGATEFDANGVLLGGWSASYLRRHLYVSYLSGAQIVVLEPVSSYFASMGILNPLGQAVYEFADFALRRHPDLGKPVVAMAVMSSHDSGFDAKHWTHLQEDTVWYGDLPYSDGDHMLDNFFKVAFPGHWLHGLAPGAPFADAGGHPDPAAFRAWLAAGGDPRPYEPMGSTRWGDNLDVIADNASLATLQRYQVIALVGDVVVDEPKRTALRTWVEAGGTLVANVKQVTADDEALLGVQLGATEVSETTSKWLADGTEYSEPPFLATQVTPTTATLLAAGGSGEPLITTNAVGRGQVILTAANHLQSQAKDRLLQIGIRLFDGLHAQHSPVTVEGEAIEYLVTQPSGRTVVALVNNTAAPWSGKVRWQGASTGAPSVKEYLGDGGVSFVQEQGQIAIEAQVPPFDLRVYSLEQN
ncbi:MAG: hypothetical protein QM765_35750 [Myxococcales bacterium]